MAYNRQYKTRQSGRYNTPGQFVPAADFESVEGVGCDTWPSRLKGAGRAAGAAAGGRYATRAPQVADTQQFGQDQSFGQDQFGQQPQFAPQTPQQAPAQRVNKPAPPPQQAQPPPPPQQNQNLQQIKTTEVDMKMEPDTDVTIQDGEASTRPAWMKYKTGGVKKISKKEKRRRQNAHLRRLIAPKNALMVLNEMMLNEQIANNFKVEPATNTSFYKNQNKHSFCADLTLDGQTYKGYGENKLSARNAAAEQAIRDLIIKRLAKVCNNETNSNGEGSDTNEGEETLPMIQIASFALHKLFSEWEYEGHKVPQIKPVSVSQSSDAEMSEPLLAPPAARPAAAKKPKELPLNACAMHPSMLLSYMRPHVDYRELAVEGDRPQNMLFTVGVEVDGSTYVGKASNKKEARKAAARAACSALFGVAFDDVATANAPQLAPA